MKVTNILEALDKVIEDLNREIRYWQFQAEIAEKKADEFDEVIGKKNDEIARLEAEITKLTTTYITVDDVAYEMEREC